ncbi:MAG: DUF3106 domain-containing protein [Limisphaerales bacterium]
MRVNVVIPMVLGVAAVAAVLMAQPTGGEASPPALPSLSSAADRTRRPPPPPPPLPPRGRSAVATFRELLAMSTADREKVLEARPEVQRSYLRDRANEFLALDPLEREARLRLLELRAVLVPLLSAEPTNRVDLLREVPAAQRDLVDRQLEAWDTLPAGRQQQVLASESRWVFLAPLPAARPGRTPDLPIPKDSGLGRRSRVESGLAGWKALPPERRQRAQLDLEEFLSLDERRRSKVLAAVPGGQRESLARLAGAFGRLAPAERSRCVGAFLQFAGMSAGERERFWQSAELWGAMGPEERRAWRAFTADLPPRPPGSVGPMPPALPPGRSTL